MSVRPFSRSRLAAATALATGALAAGALVAAPAQAAVAPATKCADVDLVIARGTQEPGPLGDVVGDGLAQQFVKQLHGARTVSTYAVDYPAWINWGSAEAGRADLVRHVEQQAEACPKQTFVLSGYSQGATVVNTALGVRRGGWLFARPKAVIPDDLAPRVKAVLLFGNPFRLSGLDTTGTYAPRVLDVCRAGDPACDLGGRNVGAHTGYGQNTGSAAAFAIQQLSAPAATAPARPSQSVPQTLDELVRRLTRRP